MKKKLRIYISYSKNNTNKAVLNNISTVLEKQGYEVVYWIESENYTTTKLDFSDIVLFIGKSERFYTGPGNEYHEYLSKGQFTELERCINNNKKILFFDAIYGGNLQEQTIKVRELSKVHTIPYITNSNDWKAKYGKAVSISKIGEHNHMNHINYILDSWFTSHDTSTTGRNKKLLLIK